MYLGQNCVHQIVMEASTPEEQKFMRSMNKQDVQQINANLLQKLYKSALDRNICDFGEISVVVSFRHIEFQTVKLNVK